MLYLFLLIFLYVLIILIEILIICFFIVVFFGAPYVPTPFSRIQIMFNLVQPKKGENLIDLGSGDGRIVILAAKKGLVAEGYEINPILVLWSKYRIRKEGLQNKAKVCFGNFWRANLKKADIVTVYGISHIMGRLEKKLKKEVKRGTRVVSFGFKFPHLKENKNKDNVYLYKF